MDPYDGAVLGQPSDPQWEPLRRAHGDTRRYAERVGLAAMAPRDDLASTRYCLANPGKEYLVYLPQGGTVTVDLSAAAGDLRTEWFNPATGKPVPAGPVRGGTRQEFKAPFTGAAVLYLW
jgi:hypothetical protein